MHDVLRRTSATDADGYLPGPLGLRLDEEFIPLSAIHMPSSELDELVPFAQRTSGPLGIWLRLWPNTLWVSGTPPQGQHSCVDISDAQTHIRLRGVEALHFLANYCTTDVHDASVRSARVVRTQIGHYSAVLWWDSTRDIHIVLARSLAQSFCDHMRSLALRHNPANPMQNLRSVPPTAPNRRG